MVTTDPWLRRLVVALAASVVIAAALWGAGALALRDSADDLDALAAARPTTTATR